MTQADETARPPLQVVHLMGRLSPGGGVQVVVRRLAEQVDPNDIDLHVVTIRPEWDDLSEVPVTLHPLGIEGSWSAPLTRLRIMWKAAAVVRALDADVVQVHSGTAWMGMIARLLRPRTPFVLEVHDAPGSGRHSTISDRFEAVLIRWLGMTAVCHSSQVADALRNLSHVPDRRIEQFPLGIDTDNFTPSAPEQRARTRAKLGLDMSEVAAVTIGRPAESKRFDLAIDAIAAARERGIDISLLIVGVGPDPALTAQRDRLGLTGQVHLLDARYGRELIQTIGACDILVSTSIYEGFGLTIIEGMACGLPVVAAAVGGVTDLVVDGETGFLVDPGSSEAVADALVELSNHPQRRLHLGDQGCQRARARFDQRTTGASFADLYRSLAG